MEDKNLTEQESLELITKMIQSSRNDLRVGAGNQLLCWGYTTAVLAVIIFLLQYFTSNGIFNWLWLLLFVEGIIMKVKSKKPEVVTYTTTAISNIWKIVGFMCVISFVASVVALFISKRPISMLLMMPLSLIYVSISVSATGVMLKNKVLEFMPITGFLIAFYMLLAITLQQPITIVWNLLMGLGFILSMAIPGHFLNAKTNK